MGRFTRIQEKQDRILAGRKPLTEDEIKEAQKLTIDFKPDWAPGLYKGSTGHGPATLKNRTSHTSAVTYRSLTLVGPKTDNHQYQVIVNGVPLRLRWNGFFSRLVRGEWVRAKGVREFQCNLSAAEVRLLLYPKPAASVDAAPEPNDPPDRPEVLEVRPATTINIAMTEGYWHGWWRGFAHAGVPFLHRRNNRVCVVTPRRTVRLWGSPPDSEHVAADGWRVMLNGEHVTVQDRGSRFESAPLPQAQIDKIVGV